MNETLRRLIGLALLGVSASLAACTPLVSDADAPAVRDLPMLALQRGAPPDTAPTRR